jgi:hypothetical protein
MSQTPVTELTAQQRFREVASILARGVIRCQRALRSVASSPEKVSPESSPGGLEVPGNTRLSVPRRIGG